jgi:hypothetical protein
VGPPGNVPDFLGQGARNELAAVVVKTASKTSGKACNPTTGQSNRVEAACTLLLSELGREEADQRDRNKPVARPYYFGVQQRRAAAANCALKSGAAPCLAPAERGGLRKSAPPRSEPGSPVPWLLLKRIVRPFRPRSPLRGG